MPAWDEYKKIAKARGALALELYVVETTPIVTAEQIKETLPKHLAYQEQLEREGKLFLAGPLSDHTGLSMEGGGLIGYRACSLQEADALAKADPMHVRKVRNYTLRKWLVNEGSPRISVGLSQQSVSLD